jgi:polysaccharide deacetylase 2 family uncharacterized protein YibQ
MEPVNRNQGGYRSSLVMIHFPEEKLRAVIADAVEAIPDFAGFCNGGGARVLEDSRVMRILFSEIKKRHGYFLEDPVAKKTIAANFARKLSIPFGTIDITVDTMMKTNQIQDLLRRCAIEAQKRGQIIISSKATDAFIRALKNQMPMLGQNGIQLSYVSEILGHRSEAEK